MCYIILLLLLSSLRHFIVFVLILTSLSIRPSHPLYMRIWPETPALTAATALCAPRPGQTSWKPSWRHLLRHVQTASSLTHSFALFPSRSCGISYTGCTLSSLGKGLLMLWAYWCCGLGCLQSQPCRNTKLLHTWQAITFMRWVTSTVDS